jgi:DNA-binding response OmpR family regulator
VGVKVTKVLVVDDERNLVNLLRGYLEREGFEMHEASDGPAAMDEVRRVAPEVVVLDWMLPGQDGVEVLRELRRSTDAYVLMLTT